MGLTYARGTRELLSIVLRESGLNLQRGSIVSCWVGDNEVS